ncbi:hypothetical protein ACRRTK_004431 [Alexandromys fortis]
MYFCGDLEDLAWLPRLPLSSDHMWKPEASLVALLAEARLNYSGRMTSAPSHTHLTVLPRADKTHPQAGPASLHASLSRTEILLNSFMPLCQGELL